MIPGNFEHLQELENLVGVNLAIRVGVILLVFVDHCVIVRVVVDQGEQFADEVQGFGLSQPLVFVSVQLRKKTFRKMSRVMIKNIANILRLATVVTFS